jgi:tetratricopeptide (TPR) repeat protein
VLGSSDLQSGLLALQRGDLAKADAILSAIVRQAPDNPDALQLLGMTRKAQGRGADAQDMLRQSLVSKPNQPHVLNNLANMLSASQQDEAELLFRQAIALLPTYEDAKANLAGILFQRGKLEESSAYYEAVLVSNSSHAQSYVGLACVRYKQERFQEGEALCRNGLALNINSQLGHQVLGNLLAAQEQWAPAADAYNVALQLGPPTSELWTSLGAAMRYLLRDQEAFEAFSNALALDAANVIAHRNVNALLWSYGRTDKYLDSYRTLLPLVPTDTSVRIAFIEDLLRHKETDEAEVLLNEIIAIDGANPEIVKLNGRLEMARGNFDGAYDPASSECQTLRLDALLKAHRFEQAFELAGPILKSLPDDQDILARYIGASKLSRRRDPLGLWNPDVFVKAIDLVPPHGRGVDDFNEELAEQLRPQHVTTMHPLDQTLRGGTQTFGNLFATDVSPIMTQLVSMFRLAITRYLDDLPRDLHHPVPRRMKTGFDFAGSWSARLAANGFHTNHIHPRGWLSSAYYVALPQETADPVTKAGWFKLGQTNMDLGEGDTPLQLIEPRVGRLILFPSFYWHGTTPFTDLAERLTVAFDVVPNP